MGKESEVCSQPGETRTPASVYPDSCQPLVNSTIIPGLVPLSSQFRFNSQMIDLTLVQLIASTLHDRMWLSLLPNLSLTTRSQPPLTLLEPRPLIGQSIVGQEISLKSGEVIVQDRLPSRPCQANQEV